MIVVDGKKIAAEILAGVKRDIAALAQKPTLHVVFVGEDAASLAYIREKQKKCAEAGIGFVLHRYPENITTTKLRRKIREIRKKRGIKSLIVQLPLPAHINAQYILDAVPPEEDTDALSSKSRGLLATGKALVLPPTAAAVLKILEMHQVKLESASCVIVGCGLLVGKPLATLLVDKVASLTVVHSRTPDIPRFTKEADILISGAGNPGLITADIVKEGVVAIDAGYSRMDGVVRGDFDFDGVSKKASAITPVPGGVGPVTVAMLLKNVAELAKTRKENSKNLELRNAVIA